MELHDLSLFRYLEEEERRNKAGHGLSTQVSTIYKLALPFLNNISGCFNNYTMHDMTHSLRVAEYMWQLVYGIEPYKMKYHRNADRLNPLETAMMMFCAILHDIGMNIRPADKEAIRNNHTKFINSPTLEAVMVSKCINEEEAIKEIVRKTHAERIQEYVNSEPDGTKFWNALILDEKYSLAEDVITICIAHGTDHNHLKNLPIKKTKGKYTYNSRYIAALLRLADYMDLDQQRTPRLWFDTMGIDGFSREEWQKHFIIENEFKLQRTWDGKLQIFFEGISDNPSIHRRYLAYVDEIRQEVEQTNELLNNKDAQNKYRLKIALQVDDRVKTNEAFAFTDLRLNLDYGAIMELLMGNHLYQDKTAGLRELIQNCIDACELRREAAEKDGKLYQPQITITIFQNEEQGYIKVRDNGIGMTYDVIRDYFLNVGKSYYDSDEFKFQGHKYDPIGQFGIGFLACFMLSDHVTVKTAHFTENQVYEVKMERGSQYVLTKKGDSERFDGTEITLDYKQVMSAFSNRKRADHSVEKPQLLLLEFIKRTFATKIPIIVVDENTKELLRYQIDYEAKVKTPQKKNNNSDDPSSLDYRLINCAENTSLLNGCIAIQESSLGYHQKMFPNGRTYFFNKNPLDLTYISNPQDIPNGFYFLTLFTNVNNEDYRKIYNREKLIKAHGRREQWHNRWNQMIIGRDEYCFLSKPGQQLIDADVSWPTKDIMEQLKITLERSGFHYHEEMFVKLRTRKNDNNPLNDVRVARNKPILVVDGFYYPIHFCYILKAVGGGEFYHKGIRIDIDRGRPELSIPLPGEFVLSSVINYVGPKLPADVSRSKVVDKNKVVNRALTLVVLRHFRSREIDNNSAISKMLGWLVDYYEKPENSYPFPKE